MLNRGTFSPWGARMKRGTTELLKFKRLCRLLKLRTWQAVGLLETLWQITARDAPDGAIGGFSNEEIALALDWQGSADKVVEALTECEWVDEHPDHRLVVHDWPDHADDLVHRKLARAGRLFADGSSPNLGRLNKAEREAVEGRFLRRQPVAKKEPESASVRTPCARDAQDVRTPCANRAHAVREPSLALPSQALPAAAGEVGDGEEQSDEPVGDAVSLEPPDEPVPGEGLDLEPYLRAVERLYPAHRKPDLVAVRSALERVTHHLPEPVKFAERLLLWRVADDWTAEAGRFVPRAEVWIAEKRFKLVPRDRSGPRAFGSRWDALVQQAIALSLVPEPAPVTT